MSYAHVAHDCVIGDHVIITNSSQVAGHCELEDWSIVEGMCGIHQFARIGAHAFIAAGSKLAQDAPPYSMVAGAERARMVGINEVGLSRRGFSAPTIAALKSAVRTIFYSKMPRPDALRAAREQHPDVPEVIRMVDFIANSKRGVVGRARA
jgi:UDP-N-acetylglucosamine acyltransferase